MTEILTESFCERCGTRYTFESAAPRQKRLGSLKVLGRGFKNFVMSDDSSLDEAFAAARSDADRDATAHQLDAFHRTFNFCMSCRQYTCANCWNEPEARCLSCAPLAVAGPAAVLDGGFDPDRLTRLLGGTVAEAPAAVDEPVAAAHIHVSEMIGDEIPAAAPEPELLAEPEPPAAELAPAEPADQAAFGGLGPGQSISDAIAAYEASFETDGFAAAGEPAAVAEVLAEPVPEPIAEAVAAAPEPAAEAVAEAAAAEVEPVAEAVVEPVAAEAVAEPAAEPVAVEAEPAAPAEPVVEVAPKPSTVAPPGVDVIDQPVWPAPAAPAAPTPVEQPPASPAAPPTWPTGPRWPTSFPARTAAPTPEPAVDPLAAIMARTSTDAMWAASSQDVLRPLANVQATAAVQPCTNCGISLSATARFCRRCGTPQG